MKNQMRRSLLLTLAVGLALTGCETDGHMLGINLGTVQLDDASQLRVEGIRGAAEYVEIIW